MNDDPNIVKEWSGPDVLVATEVLVPRESVEYRLVWTGADYQVQWNRGVGWFSLPRMDGFKAIAAYMAEVAAVFADEAETA